MSRINKKLIILLIEYDGTNYAGWQKQKNAITIQERIEQAIQKAFGFSSIPVGAGRTDAGVHARGQVAHCVVPKDFSLPEERIALAINSKLPEDIRIINAKITENPFHATIDAIARRYSYYIHTKSDVFIRNYSCFVPYKFDVDKLFESAKIFLGEWNFKEIAKKNHSTESYVCRIEKSYWEKIGDYKFHYTIQANRFVYSLVRAIIGLMLEIARGRRSIEELRTLLITNKRNFHFPLAPPNGLFLDKAIYPEGKNFFD